MGIIYTDNLNGEGHEFDYYDDHPDEDPFSPKPTCPNCNGLGEVTVDDRTYTCTWCGGSGCSK